MSPNNFPIQVCSLNELSQFNVTRIVAAIGVFDGIHLGHQVIIKELIKMSVEQSATPAVITFSPHPRRVLWPDKHLRLLLSYGKKAEILGSLGIKAIVTVPFTLEFASLSPNEFIRKFMHPHSTKLAGICVGSKWRFGSGGKGDEQTLHDFADKYGFVFKSIKETYWNGKPVSSTAIRSALSKGDFFSANYMLNKKYSISGHVVDFGKLENNNIIKAEIDYGILPPVGRYTAYINNNKNIEISIEVISQSELNLNANNLFSVNEELEIVFIKRNFF
jgi:riboflavin kinase / FMN adenylyltransferase